MIGNSSGGIIETPTLGIPNLLIGYRQLGREIANNTLTSNLTIKGIRGIITKSLNDENFLKKCKLKQSPYFKKNQIFPSKQIVNVLKSVKIKDIKNKQIAF